MNDFTLKLLLAVASAGLGSTGTYVLKAVSIEGRLEAIEKTSERNERKLDYLVRISTGPNDKVYK